MTDKTRAYQKSHPWIDFIFDARRLDHRIWHRLGKIEAHCEYVAYVPLLPSIAEDLQQVYLAKGALATTAIEGNTLTEAEALQAVRGELDLPPSKAYLQQEIENVIEAANAITYTNMALRSEDVKQINAMILRNLPLREEVRPGDYRHHQVVVTGTGYRGAPVEDIAYLVGQLCDWLHEWNMEEFPVAFGILKAIVAHVYLAWIHPFGDGNGRTARLLELQILLTSGLPMPTAHLLSNHYNQTRSEYYRFLDITSQRKHGLYDFIAYALQGFVDNLAEQVARIETHQLEVNWNSTVEATFKNQEGKTATRQYHLVMDISDKKEAVPLSEIRHVSPRVAEAYATLDDRTLRRDVNTLVDMALLKKTPDGFIANRESTLAFMPHNRG